MRPKSGRFACELATSSIVTLTSGSWMFVMERIRMSFLPEAKSPALGLIELAFLGLADRGVVLPRPRIPSPVHGKGRRLPRRLSTTGPEVGTWHRADLFGISALVT